MRFTSGPATWRARIAPVLLAVAAVLYCTILVEAAYGFPFPLAGSTLSEIAARGQPSSTVARVVDLTSGALMLVTAALWWQPSPWRSPVRATCVGLVLLGVGTVVSDLFPLPCAPSLSAACARRVDTVSGLGVLWHAGSSTTAAAGSLLLTAVVWLAVRRDEHPFRGRLGRVAVWVVVATSVLLLVDTVVGLREGRDGPLVGLWQRVSVLAQCVVLVMLPQALTRLSGGRRDATGKLPAAVGPRDQGRR